MCFKTYTAAVFFRHIYICMLYFYPIPCCVNTLAAHVNFTALLKVLTMSFYV